MSDDVVSRLNAALEGRYAIERDLGEGGMATVYLAEDLKHERRVALKVLKPELAAVVGAERFLAEIKTTAGLQHPHILPLHDSGEADSFLFYVMPYVEGETLRQRIDREKQLAVQDALAITQKVANALDYAHGHGVVHRDIKPANILLSRQGEPLVADFGIALAVAQAGAGRITETGLSLGTPHYMSPEQATGERDVDVRSDVYALGCVLYEMLAGQPPFVAPTAQAVLVRVLTTDPAPITTLRRTVPPNVEAVLARALEKLPADRFESTKAFAEALEDPGFTHAVRAPSGTAVAMSAAVGAGTPARRAPANRMLAGATLLLAVVAAWGWARAIARPAPAITRVSVNLSSDEVFAATFDLAPDGSFIVYEANGDEGVQLWLRRMDDLEPEPIRGTVSGTIPAISPDGQSVSFLRRDRGSVHVVSLAGGPTIEVAGGSIPGWGPDGALYQTGTWDGGAGLRRWVTLDSDPELVVPADSASGQFFWFDILPGGGGALITLWDGREGAEIAAASFADGTLTTLVEGTFPRYAQSGHIVYVRADGALMAAPFDENALALTGPAVPLVEGVRVSPGGNAGFALAGNGSLVYATGSGTLSTIVRVDRDGREEVVDPDLTGQVGSLAVSPDGERLALSMSGADGRDIHVKALPQGPLTRLTFEGTANYRPVWSRDGASVLFISNRNDRWQFWSRRADGSRNAERLFSFQRAIAEGFVLADGSMVLRTFPGQGLSRDIFHVPANDSVARPFVSSDFDEEGVHPSPDGQWLAYGSAESGSYEIFVRPFPEGDGRWQISIDGGRTPRWSHEGRELFFVSPNGELMAVDVTTESTFAAQTPLVLFSTEDYQGGNHSYDVAPDDQGFYFIKRLGGDGSVVLVLNFFEELKERIGN